MRWSVHLRAPGRAHDRRITGGSPPATRSSTTLGSGSHPLPPPSRRTTSSTATQRPPAGLAEASSHPPASRAGHQAAGPTAGVGGRSIAGADEPEGGRSLTRVREGLTAGRPAWRGRRPAGGRGRALPGHVLGEARAVRDAHEKRIAVGDVVAARAAAIARRKRGVVDAAARPSVRQPGGSAQICPTPSGNIVAKPAAGPRSARPVHCAMPGPSMPSPCRATSSGAGAAGGGASQ